jgi:hypothetical protein
MSDTEYDANYAYVVSSNYHVNVNSKVVTVDDTISDYTTVSDDVVIQADASNSNITINLTTVKPAASSIYFIKRIDANVSNTVTILPQTGSTIDSAASYVLNRLDEVVQLSYDNYNFDWVVVNGKLDRLLTTKGDLYGHNTNHVVRVPVGTNGQVLSSDSSSSNGLRWINNTTGSTTYQILSNRICVITTQYVPVAYFPWSNSLHSSLSNGKIVFRTTIENRILNIRLYDITHGVSLGSYPGINATGTYHFNVINPSNDAEIQLQVSTGSQGGIKPQVLGALLEFSG